MLDTQILSLLCCPEDRSLLTEADSATIEQLNQKIRAGLLKNRSGQPVTEPIDGALIRKDRQYAYPIRQEIPVLLVDEALDVSGLI